MRGPLSRPGQDETGTTAQTSLRHHPPWQSAMRHYAVAPIHTGGVALRHVGSPGCNLSPALDLDSDALLQRLRCAGPRGLLRATRGAATWAMTRMPALIYRGVGLIDRRIEPGPRCRPGHLPGGRTRRTARWPLPGRGPPSTPRYPVRSSARRPRRSAPRCRGTRRGTRPKARRRAAGGVGRTRAAHRPARPAARGLHRLQAQLLSRGAPHGTAARLSSAAPRPLLAPVLPFARGVLARGRGPELARDREPPTPADRQEADPEAECRARDRRRG